MNYKYCCRTCLGNNKEMRHCQTVISIAGVDVKLTDILKTFYDYEITTNDSYPENICINCVHHLTVTYSFKVLIEKSSKTLEEYTAAIDSSCNNYDSDLGFDDQKSPNDSNDFYPKKSVDYKKVLKKTVKKMCSQKNDKNNLLFCVECKAQFNSSESLREHCSKNHPVKSTVGQDCDYCDEKFEDFGSLIKHMKLHLKPYPCDDCWEGFYSQSDLKSHQCRLSQKKALDKTLKRNLQQCEQCGKSYPPGYIKLHLKIHGNDTPYSCKYCPKKFKVRCSLNSHVLWMHKKTKNHACHICNATFINASMRNNHIRLHHLKEKKHICATCGKKFFKKYFLDRHNLTHTGEKKFHCEMCAKSYQTRYGLNVHLKSHSNKLHTHKIEEIKLEPIDLN